MIEGQFDDPAIPFDHTHIHTQEGDDFPPSTADPRRHSASKALCSRHVVVIVFVVVVVVVAVVIVAVVNALFPPRHPGTRRSFSSSNDDGAHIPQLPHRPISPRTTSCSPLASFFPTNSIDSRATPSMAPNIARPHLRRPLRFELAKSSAAYDRKLFSYFL
ncbi:nicotinamide N-methyltransferase [Colletotrichum orchidophilum]|uniref:Nicotinamide N-methyltransferase n=1 Tax=Colletotrichum orchidophilum TaxID=1209926 RepID=A0A1G4ANF3_9PEZI|nr:nicotinamide N-methyltransferase [Colletotrichum orchidophilum]OHE90651.1 nicotinamide N-methyltransferase [Colletotrichum orchidophilum]